MTATRALVTLMLRDGVREMYSDLPLGKTLQGAETGNYNTYEH